MRVLPGAVLGVLGGGQLGRMFVAAAQRMGYQIAVLDPAADNPTGRSADYSICADYDDEAALGSLADRCVAITAEF